VRPTLCAADRRRTSSSWAWGLLLALLARLGSACSTGPHNISPAFSSQFLRLFPHIFPHSPFPSFPQNFLRLRSACAFSSPTGFSWPRTASPVRNSSLFQYTAATKRARKQAKDNKANQSANNRLNTGSRQRGSDNLISRGNL
jgi:hypothetical protein